ncbi:MAG: DUF2752 domain-containing protein [Lachnospiraceae bacterium]|nr:DUF2752 domain-containing protein [Lachnospiraceae bacterium]
MKQRRSLEDILFVMGLAATVFVAAGAVLLAVFPGLRAYVDVPCRFYEITGLYCPGCGGTRALRFLLHGNVFSSLYEHPAVLCGGILFVWFMVSQALSRLTKGRVRGLIVRDWMVWGMLIVIVGNWIIKNAAMLLLGHDVLL